EGRRLDALEVLDPRWCRPLAGSELAAALEGRTVERLGRRGKYLVFELDGDGTPAHTRVWFAVGEHRLAFVDPRRFGTGELALGPEALEAFFTARLGVEPLEQSFTAEHLYALARTSRAPV